MTKRQFWQAEQRALERLNPKMLCGGLFVRTSQQPQATCCALGAFLLSRTSKGRIEPNEFYTRWANSVVNYTPGMRILSSENDRFRRGANEPDDQRARWEHVYAFVCAKLGEVPA